MDIKLKLHIKTPNGTARRIEIDDDGELLFIAPRRVSATDRFGNKIYDVIDEAFSFDSVTVWIVEEDD